MNTGPGYDEKLPTNEVTADALVVVRRRLRAGRDESFESLVLRPSTKPPDGGWPVMVFLHGQNSSKEVWADRLARYCVLGLAIVIPDLRGHGDRRIAGLDPSGAIPVLDYFSILDGTANDVISLIDSTEDAHDLAAGHLGVVGFSMGGQVALAAAVRDPRISALAVLGGVTDMAPPQASNFPASMPDPVLFHDAWRQTSLADSLDDLAGDRRILFLHGEFDEAAPIAPMRELFELLVPYFAGRPGELGWFSHPGGHHPPAEVLSLAAAWLRYGVETSVDGTGVGANAT